MRSFFLSSLLILTTVCGYPQPNCSAPSTNLIPINDLGKGTFNSWTGGLYPGGSNFLPLVHKAAGINIATTQIVPRDALGNPDPVNGKIVWLSIGMSNATAEAQQFIPLANNYLNKNPKLILVDGAVGGMTTSIISTPSNSNYATYWNTVASRLSAAGVTASQVQVIWYKEANVANAVPIMNYYDSLVVQTKRAMNIIKQRFPNARLGYMASRISARYASSALNPEPYAYYTGWAIKKVIEDQINNDPSLKFSGADAKSPWLAWGIYMWSDGNISQVTNQTVFWSCPSDLQNDGIHPSAAGSLKVANLLLDFYKNDTISCPWFFNNPPFSCQKTAGNENAIINNTCNSLSPNPASEKFQINTTFQEYRFSLYYIDGQKIHSEMNIEEMNILNLNSGVYFYTILSNEGQIKTGKLIVAR